MALAVSSLRQLLIKAQRLVTVFCYIQMICIKYKVILGSENVVASNEVDLSSVAPCNHEEADRRIFLHVRHAAECGHRKVVVSAVDTGFVESEYHCFQI